MDHLSSARRTLQIEQEALQAVHDRLDGQFAQAVTTLLSCSGKVVVTGMGKSGLIGQKMAATFSSTGTPAFFLHPAEALHGDLGMLSDNDVVILLSYSGETEELLRLMAYLQQKGHRHIAITGYSDSTLARHAHIHLNVAVPREACPLELAPTASTTATLAMGDALAVACMEARGFRPDDFARFHPGGSLGRKLLTRVGEVMRTDKLPFVSPDITPGDLLLRMSEGKLGLAIVGSPDAVQGVITDGDLRRGMVQYGGIDHLDIPAMMSRQPVIVQADMLVGPAEQLMRDRKITVVLVEQQERIVGVYQIFS